MLEERKSPQTISFELGGRRYGEEALPPEERVSQTIPDVEVFRELTASLRQRSALLALNEVTLRSKDPIYDAYAKDLELLGKCYGEFASCLHMAIRCSIAGGDAERRADTWELLKQQIPPVPTTQLLELPYTRAALPLTQLLVEMKQEFGRGVERVLKSLADWLQMLAEEELVGIVEWGDVDVCRYHYFRQEIQEAVLASEKRTEYTEDRTKPLGERRQEKTIREWQLRRRQFRERHVHHIVRAQLHNLKEYAQPVPRHVADFLNSVPASLRPHLLIVEGTITMEEVLRRQVAEQVVVKSEVLSVYKYSPGVLFGPFNLIGWSSDDLMAGAIFYDGQRAAKSHVRGRQHRLTRIMKRVAGHLFSAR